MTHSHGGWAMLRKKKSSRRVDIHTLLHGMPVGGSQDEAVCWSMCLCTCMCQHVYEGGTVLRTEFEGKWGDHVPRGIASV